MPDPSHLRAATADEIADVMAFALRYEGRKRVHHADEVIARIAAERLVEHLVAAGFVVMRKPPRLVPTTSGMPKSVG